MKRISAGILVIDKLLGGYEADCVTTVYGPAGSGKTNLCMFCLKAVVEEGKKVIYVDTEGSFSVDRFKQICQDYDKALENVIFIKPISLEEQKKAFDILRKNLNDKVGLVIVDSIAPFYRLQYSNTQDIQDANRELSLQLNFLTEIARRKEIPVLITNQVYASFDDKNKVNMVGGDILKYASKCLIELQKAHKGKRVAIIRKHRSMPEGKEAVFEIKEKEIVEAE
jgi:DNA repair protein RadB